MIYEISISFVQVLEQTVSRFIRKWLGLHKTISSIALYSKLSPCPLPLTSLTGLLKTAKAGCLLQLRDSKDPIVSKHLPSVRAGRTWSVTDSVKDAESVLYFRQLVGSVCKGKAGFGYIPSEPFPAKGTKDHRKLVSDTVFEEHDKRRLQEETEEKLKVLQFNWKSWNDYIRKDLSWKCIWATPPDLLRFIIGSTFNTLPSPNNRVRWRISDEDKCFLCGIGPCTVSHILSGCAFSLARASGRYSFRHDSVVKGLVEELIDQI